MLKYRLTEIMIKIAWLSLTVYGFCFVEPPVFGLSTAHRAGGQAMKASGNGTDALDQGSMQPGKIKVLDVFFLFLWIVNVNNVFDIFLQGPNPVGHGQGYAQGFFNGSPAPGNGVIGAGPDALIALVPAGIKIELWVRFQFRVGQDGVKIDPRSELGCNYNGRNADGTQTGFRRHVTVGEFTENSKVVPIRIYHGSI